MAVKPEEVALPPAQSLQQVIGALLFGSNKALTLDDIKTCLKQTADKEGADENAKLYAGATQREIRDVLDGIEKELARIGLGFDLIETGTGFRFQTQVAAGPWLRQLLKAEPAGRLSRPTLETLAIIAYRQPIAKSEIESIRGVAVDYIVKALMELHLIRIIGRSDLPGRPFLYGTTPSFLEHFGLKSLAELNELDPTLQRSTTAERSAKHKKPKKPEEAGAKTKGRHEMLTLDAGDLAPSPQPVNPSAEPEEELPDMEELSGALAEVLGKAKTDFDEPVFEPMGETVASETPENASSETDSSGDDEDGPEDEFDDEDEDEFDDEDEDDEEDEDDDDSDEDEEKE